MSNVTSFEIHNSPAVIVTGSRDNGDAVGFRPPTQTGHRSGIYRRRSYNSRYGRTVVRPLPVHRCHRADHWHNMREVTNVDIFTNATTDYPQPALDPIPYLPCYCDASSSLQRPRPTPFQPPVLPRPPPPPQQQQQSHTTDQCTQTDEAHMFGPYQNRGNVRSVTRQRMQMRGVYGSRDDIACDVDCLVIVLNRVDSNIEY